MENQMEKNMGHAMETGIRCLIPGHPQFMEAML